jgi:copper(I)-binding protein
MTSIHRSFRTARAMRRALLLALVLSPIAASTHEYYGLDFTLIHPWADATEEDQLGAAPVYFSMESVRASTRFAESVEFRSSDAPDAKVIKAIDIAPADKLDFGKGGPHMVLRNLNVPLQWGRSYEMTMVFEKSGAMQVMVSIGAH